MFAGSPCLNDCHWHDCHEARPLLIEVCRGLVRIGDEELYDFTKVPEGYVVSYRRNLYNDLRKAKEVASEYLELST
jgi:hypothetical protein